MKLLLASIVCVSALITSVLSAADAAPEKIRKVVLIAGVKSHGPEGNGVHDYNWSARLLRAMLEQSDVKDRLRVEHHLNGWPKDPKSLDDADAIVVISDGRDGDKYSDALHLQSKERVAEVDRLMKRGCGLVLIHFSNFAPEQYADEVLRWVGGYFKWETDGKRQWYSAIKTLDAEASPMAAEHAALRGVKPFRMKEEFYYNLKLATKEQGVTPLLAVPDLKGREPGGNVVAWAMQRPADQGGGRGFCTTCGHFYDNWKNDMFRKMMLNGIAWSAGVEVPGKGVESAYIPREQIKTP